MRFIFEKYDIKENRTISKIHGKIYKVRTLSKNLIILPLYHPAVGVYNPNMIEVMKKDFETLKKLKSELNC